MIYFANPCSEGARDAMVAGRIGCIVTPDQGNRYHPEEWDTIADNGCFSGRWTEAHWLAWLLDQPRTVRFAVAPDVFDPTGRPCHAETVDRWNRYGPMIERHGFTPAFVCQVGATPDNVPDAPVMFLGGTTEWKLGPAAEIVTAARDRGAWVHMGRVNSLARFRAARSMGCDSADGTYLTFGPDVNLPRLLGWLDDQQAAPMLWEPVS